LEGLVFQFSAYVFVCVACKCRR